MAKLAQKGKILELNNLLNKTLKFIFLVMPVSILFMILSHEIITILFQRGQFDARATMFTAGILPFFMIGAFAFSAQNIVSRGFYATQNTIFPAIFTTVCVIVTLPLILLFMKTMGAKGVALGLSLSVILQAFILFECWNKKSNNFEKREVYLFFFKMIPISLIIGIILFLSKYGIGSLINTSEFSGSLFMSFTIGIEFIFIFYFSGVLFKIEEILILYQRIFKLMLRRGK
jgi:putative peptidoglycan lipid II flippase